MVTIEARGRPTYEDYINLPGDDRYELINGEFILVSAPNRAHQAASMGFSLELGRIVRDSDLGWVFAAPFEVVLTDSEGVNIIQPDIIFVSKEREHIITPANIQGAPDLVVEILSPSSRRRDTTTKSELYARHGVKEYWIADPDAQTIRVTLLEEGDFQVVADYCIDEELSSPTLEGFSVALSKIFS